MLQEEFELSIINFFKKAEVEVLKKGEAYDDIITFPSYVLLDKKRNAYYLTETDMQSTTPEIVENIKKFSESANISENIARVIYRIGQMISFNSQGFSLANRDLSNLECKFALIIRDENGEAIKEYLDNNSYNYQFVPLKNKFLVIFFDKSEESNLLNIYKKYTILNDMDETNSISPIYTPTLEKEKKEEKPLYSNKAINNELDKKDETIKKPITEKKVTKNKVVQDKKDKYGISQKSWLDKPGKIASHIIGVLFFLPIYLLNKFTRKFLPAFVIYWITAIIIIFGGYQLFYSLFPQPFNKAFIAKSNEAISLMQNYEIVLEEGEEVSEIANVSFDIIEKTAIYYQGLLYGVDTLINNGYLLQYLLGLGAIMLIFPAFRFIGKAITIFSILSYFWLPAIAYLQAIFIEKSMNFPEVYLVATATQFLVYIYPVIMLFFFFIVSASLVPNKNIRKEVLP